MPEHVHLLVSEPERGTLAIAMQMLKQTTAKRLLPPLPPRQVDTEQGPSQRASRRFWQIRYYDFNVRTDEKRIEKLKYIHRNPVKRGLVQKPEDWAWSSFVHYATGVEGVVEIESEWTGRRRERMEFPLRLSKREDSVSHPVVQQKDDKDGAPSS